MKKVSMWKGKGISRTVSGFIITKGQHDGRKNIKVTSGYSSLFVQNRHYAKSSSSSSSSSKRSSSNKTNTRSTRGRKPGSGKKSASTQYTPTTSKERIKKLKMEKPGETQKSNNTKTTPKNEWASIYPKDPMDKPDKTLLREQALQEKMTKDPSSIPLSLNTPFASGLRGEWYGDRLGDEKIKNKKNKDKNKDVDVDESEPGSPYEGVMRGIKPTDLAALGEKSLDIDPDHPLAEEAYEGAQRASWTRTLKDMEKDHFKDPDTARQVMEGIEKDTRRVVDILTMPIRTNTLKLLTPSPPVIPEDTTIEEYFSSNTWTSKNVSNLANHFAKYFQVDQLKELEAKWIQGSAEYHQSTDPLNYWFNSELESDPQLKIVFYKAFATAGDVITAKSKFEDLLRDINIQFPDPESEPKESDSNSSSFPSLVSNTENNNTQTTNSIVQTKTGALVNSKYFPWNIHKGQIVKVDPNDPNPVSRRRNLQLEKQGKSKEILERFEPLTDPKKLQILSLATILARAYSQHGLMEPIFSVVKFLSTRDIEPDKEFYLYMIQSCVRNDRPERAWEIFDFMRTYKGIEPDEKHYTQMINACGTSRETEKAFVLFDELKYLGIQPNESHFTALITACARRSDFFFKGWETLEMMKLSGYFPTPVTYLALLQMCCQTPGRMTFAERMFDVIKDQNFLGSNEIGTKLWHTFMVGYTREIESCGSTARVAANLARVEAIMMEMQKLGVSTDMKLEEARLSAYVSASRIRTSETLFNEMQNKWGSQELGKGRAWTQMMKLYMNTRRPENALELWRKMREHKIETNMWDYEYVVGAMSRSGYVKSAMTFLREMRGKGWTVGAGVRRGLLKKVEKWPELVGEVKALTELVVSKDQVRFTDMMRLRRNWIEKKPLKMRIVR